MKIKPDTNQRSSYGPQEIADSSSQSFHAMIEEPEFSGTLERNSDSQHVLTRDPFTALKGGIGDKKIPVIPVPDFDEPMKNKTPVFFVQEKGSGAGIGGGRRPNLYGISVADRGVHAWTAGGKTDRRILLQKMKDHLAGIGCLRRMRWKSGVGHDVGFLSK